jgi:LuxR family maltose regulon positive regulatory protein
VQLWLALGDLSAARSWAEQSSYDPHQPPLYPEELAYGALARIYLTHPAADMLRQAEALLSSALAVAEEHGRTGHIIKLLLLQALALYAQGNNEPALAALSRSLSLAEPEGYVRTFVDAGQPLLPLLRMARAQGIAPTYVTRLQEACAQEHTPDTVPASVIRTWPLAEPLTPREQEVLRLLVAGLSNAEIADRLVITVGTTKRHVLHIYGKLDVRTRAQAIVKARELGLAR